MYSRHKCFQLPVVEFQSTRLSRASTCKKHNITANQLISIHKALTSLDMIENIWIGRLRDFNPQGSHEPRPFVIYQLAPSGIISIHKALTSLDESVTATVTGSKDFNPQGSHEPRQDWIIRWIGKEYFNPQGSHEPRLWWSCQARKRRNFNPQVSHEPRRHKHSIYFVWRKFQSTRLSRASTAKIHNYPCIHAKFIYLNYTPSTNHPASQKIFSYFNPIFRPFAVRIPLEFYVQLLFAPELPY